MAEIVLFHHAQGLTTGVRALAETLRQAGHAVHTPDLFEGATFPTVEEGVAHAGEVGFGEIIGRGVRAVAELPDELVYAGLSLGVLPAQKLAQTRPGARGALLLHSAIPISEFGESWPAGVPVQIHTMEGDEFYLEDEAAAKELVEQAGAELFLYPGDQHLFSDNSLAAYDATATALMTERILDFLTKPC